ncbi:hypothetical protein C8Q77DRAFT_141956 [Trametes polyzona]|nr:hypothetical protein C8Q77DRAFT_141956 [Trametes polyzona]
MQEAYNNRVHQRSKQLSGRYVDWVQDISEQERALMPNPCDGALLPCLYDLARCNDAQGDITHEDFLALAGQVLVQARAYAARARATAVQMLLDGMWYLPESEAQESWAKELEGLSTDEALSRHYALFECKRISGVCDTGIFTFEELHAHWRTAHPQHSWGTAASPPPHHQLNARCKLITHICTWGSYRVGGAMLDAVGIPRETPRTELDGLVKAGRLYCSCGDPSMPLPEDSDWRTLFGHVAGHVHAFELRMEQRAKGSHSKVTLKNTHVLTAPNACVQLIPEGADTSPAYTRLTIGLLPHVRADGGALAGGAPGRGVGRAGTAPQRRAGVLLVRGRLRPGQEDAGLSGFAAGHAH